MSTVFFLIFEKYMRYSERCGIYIFLNFESDKTVSRKLAGHERVKDTFFNC